MISSSSSSDGLSSSSSSSEDEATADVKIVDKNEEEQLRVLKKQREARMELREAVREHGARPYSREPGHSQLPSARPKGRPKGRPRRRGQSNRGRRLRLSCRKRTKR